MTRILVADPDLHSQQILADLLAERGYEFGAASDVSTALEPVSDGRVDLILADLSLPGGGGMELLEQVQRGHPETAVVLLSAFGSVQDAVKAMRHGAADFLGKPFAKDQVLLAVDRALEKSALKRENQELKLALDDRLRLDNVIGCDPRMQAIFKTVQAVADTRTTVLITGESGTGKEIAARAIHYLSPLQSGPFVAIDCGALPEHLLESQLFGHERGAFTGADRSRQGLFSMADGGTLFLDELGNLPVPLQAKLLRALQERVIVPVGGSKPVPFRARLLTATNSDLQLDIEAGRFRVDLYHRIAEFTVTMPPLRERPDDIVYFARAFLAEANVEMGRRVDGFSEAGEAVLRQHPWPGNLRELRNAVRRMVLLATSTELHASDLGILDPQPSNQPSISALAAGADMEPLAKRLRQATDALEAEILRQTLAACDGNKAAAARTLSIDYTTLHRKLKRHDIAPTSRG
ncbi:MAG TPA: sigma-54-dependent Fis family transcriptional regulator [Planctomycetes bacterium]|nr:sigma-54-dependent Fis family transcriptional regulator [Planctomycetota bacterium]